MQGITRFTLRGRSVWLKRDDLLSLPAGPTGNKARKLLSLSNRHPSELSDVLTYGGAQSNMMEALSALCSAKGWRLHYLTHDAVPDESVLVANKNSNYACAAQSGCFKHYKVPRSVYDAAHCYSDANDYNDMRDGLFQDHGIPTDALWVPQGGSWPGATAGCKALANELGQLAELCEEGLTVAIPSGTGTTALLTAAHCGENVSVLALPCVGSGAQLKQQIERIAARCNVTTERVQVLEPIKRTGFGHPCKKILRSWKEVVAASEVEMDLVYGGPAWHILLQHEHMWTEGDGRQLCYVHSGGMRGHVTQLERYQRRGYL